MKNKLMLCIVVVFILMSMIIMTCSSGCKKIDPPYEHEKVVSSDTKNDDVTYDSVEIICSVGTFTTNKKVEFGNDTTLITLPTGKRIWINNALVAKEL